MELQLENWIGRNCRKPPFLYEVPSSCTNMYLDPIHWAQFFPDIFCIDFFSDMKHSCGLPICYRIPRPKFKWYFSSVEHSCIYYYFWKYFLFSVMLTGWWLKLLKPHASYWLIISWTRLLILLWIFHCTFSPVSSMIYHITSLLFMNLCLLMCNLS